MKLHIKGNSGCNIEISGKEVIKSTNSSLYNQRLKQQSNKQELFKSSVFHAPKIHKSGIKKGKYFFTMDYIPYKTFDQAFKFADKIYLDHISEKIILFIKENITGVKNFSSEIIISKFNATEEKIKKKNIDVSYLKDLFYSLDTDIKLPTGPCHGDLTFSNLLFDNEDIVVIDFLDTYLDSPIQDIVKIKQDTQFFWSLMMLNYHYDRVKIMQCLSYIDTKLEMEFSKLDYYVKYYKIFQILNLMRIIPYCDNINDINFLQNRIKKIWQH